MDRWLLGETSGSDEARALERHLATCTDCSSRLRSLRSLYSGAVVTTLPTEPAIVPSSARAGLLQVIILRDGLLVGTEMFTSGSWTIGSAPAALVLDGVTEAAHARLEFHDGTVSVEAQNGRVFVNGHRVTNCPLRPVDEISIGPWTLRTRVVADRWAPKPATPIREVTPLARVLQLPATKVMWAPKANEVARAPATLKLELWWGDALQRVDYFDGDVVRDFPMWHVDEGQGAVVACRRDGVVHLMVPQGAQVVGGESTQLSSVGQTVSLVAGRVTLRATLVPRPESAGKERLFEVPRSMLVLASLLACVFAAMSLHERPEDDGLVTRPIDPVAIQLKLPPKKPQKPEPSTGTATPKPTPDAGHRPPKPPSNPRVGRAPPKLPPGLAGLLDDKFAKMFDTLGNGPKRSAGSKTGSLGALPGVASVGGGILGDFGKLGGGERIGIGDAGKLGAGRVGRGAVGGRVSSQGAIVRPANGASIDQDRVKTVVNQHMNEVYQCYEHALLSGADISGSAKIEWAITTSGSVSGVKLVGGTINDNGAVTSCIMRAITRWQFPKARGGTVFVSYPFVFKSV